ncbi:hypothetical protein ACFL0V_04340 [Nanoarchaeota archaeon]
MTTIAEFKKTASPEQAQVIDRLVAIHRETRRESQIYFRLQGDIDYEVRSAQQRWGLQTQMVAIDLELYADHLLPARNMHADRIIELRQEASQLLQQSVTELDMQHLGYVQRNYQRIVGTPIPHLHLVP